MIKYDDIICPLSIEFNMKVSWSEENNYDIALFYLRVVSAK